MYFISVLRVNEENSRVRNRIRAKMSRIRNTVFLYTDMGIRFHKSQKLILLQIPNIGRLYRYRTRKKSSIFKSKRISLYLPVFVLFFKKRQHFLLLFHISMRNPCEGAPAPPHLNKDFPCFSDNT